MKEKDFKALGIHLSMSILKKLANNIVVKNASYVTIGGILAQLINLIALIKIAKIFSPSYYGVYTFLGVQEQLLVTLADLGIRNIIIRTIARNKMATNDILVNGILLRMGSTLIVAAIYYIYNLYAGSLSNVYVALICIYVFFNCISNLLESIFWGHQKMLPTALVNVSTSIIWLTTVYFLPLKSFTVQNIFIILFCINVVLAGSIYFIVLKVQKLLMGKIQPFLKSSTALLKESWPYFMLILISIPFGYLTNNYLDINSTKTEIGYFNLTQKLISPVSMVIGFTLSALFPNLSSLWVNDEGKFKRLLVKGIRSFMLVALLCCFMFTLFIDEAVHLILPKYAPVVKVTQLQIWYVFLMGTNSLIGTIWGATNNEKKFIKSTFINVCISAPILFFGSKYGAIGLSYAYVISFALFEVYLWNDFKKSIKITIPQDKLLWLIAIFLFVVSYYLLDKVGLILKISISGLIISTISYYIYKISRKQPVVEEVK